MIEFLLSGFWGLEGVRDIAQSLSTCLTHRNPGLNPYTLKTTQVRYRVTRSATFRGKVQAVYRMLYFHLAEYTLSLTKWRILNWTRPVTQPTTWNLSDLDPQRQSFHTVYVALIDLWKGSCSWKSVSKLYLERIPWTKHFWLGSLREKGSRGSYANNSKLRGSTGFVFSHN